MSPRLPLLPTSTVGSHGLPGWVWLAREALASGRLGVTDLRELAEDATQLALLDQERAGVDVLTTGEMGRVRFIIGFYDRLAGIRALEPPRKLGQPHWDTNTPFEVMEPVTAPDGLGIVEEWALARSLKSTYALTRAGAGPEIGMRRGRRLLALALAGACALLPGCGRDVSSPVEETPAASKGPAYGDTLIQATIGDIAGLIPNLTTDGASHDVGNMIYDGLVKADKDLNYVAAMAESWEFSKDCLELTWKLRRDIKWHDGHPFTADDVLFTYQAMINPKTPTAYKEDFLAVQSAEVIDPYTFRVTYARPLAKAVESWSMWMLPKHLLEKYAADGTLKESPENSRPVGTGPYRFQEWQSGEKVVLRASPDYYEGRPFLGRIVYRVIPNQGTIFLELKAKGVDLASLTAIQYSRQTEYPAFRKAFRKHRYPSSAYTYFGFNLKDPRFADRRVRQAFAHAINKQELIEGILMGLAREATGPIRPGTWAHTDKVDRFEYSPEKAKALLAEVGWKDGGDGILRDKDSRPFSFTIRTNQGNEERKKVAEIIQQRLAAIGVQTEIQVIEWASFIKEFIKKKQFEAIVLGWGVGTDPDQFGVWHSSQTGPDQLNQISYGNPEVDRLLEEGRANCHPEERIKYYHRFQEILAQDQPVVFLYFRDALPAISSRVQGVRPGPSGILHNFTQWYVPTQLQRYTSG